MTKQSIKVGFNFRYAPSGTVYNKSFGVTEHIYNTFIDVIACEVAQGKDKTGWIDKIPEREGNAVFLNLTQADFFVKWISKLADVEINLKRANVKNNAYLIIKD